MDLHCSRSSARTDGRKLNPLRSCPFHSLMSPNKAASLKHMLHARSYKRLFIYLAKHVSMLILTWFGINAVSTLCICFVKLYLDSTKYGVRKVKSYYLYPCKLILWKSRLCDKLKYEKWNISPFVNNPAIFWPPPQGSLKSNKPPLEGRLDRAFAVWEFYHVSGMGPNS